MQAIVMPDGDLKIQAENRQEELLLEKFQESRRAAVICYCGGGIWIDLRPESAKFPIESAP